MPFGVKPVCFRCNIEESSIWRKILNDEQPNKEEIICNNCSIELKKTRVYLDPNDEKLIKIDDNHEKETTNSEGGGSISSKTLRSDLKGDQTKQSKIMIRKSTRNKKGSNRLNLVRNQSGKGRRNIFKRNVYKSPSSICYPMTRESVYHNGINYTVGDIVSMIDADEGTTYFAQIKGFLQDQYCEKSAAITWLVPNSNKGFKPISEFNPADYILGPEEDYPRKLDCMEFVCRSPSNYFKATNSPYLTARPSIKEEFGYIWTRLGPVIFSKDDNEDDLDI